jgi:hypothetical protein
VKTHGMTGPEYGVGSVIEVKLFDARIVQAKVKNISETAAGRKIRIAFEQRSSLIYPSQVLGVVTK